MTAIHAEDRPRAAGDGEVTPDRLPAVRGRRLPVAYLAAAAVLPVILASLWAVRLVTAAPPAATIGSVAPDISAVGLDGKPVRLADLRGRPVMVNFWASWCVPCVAEFPLLRQAARDHAAQGLAIVGVVYDDNAQAARDFMRRMGAAWSTATDPDGTIAAAYGIRAAPDTFFISRDGVVEGRQIGELNAADLARQLDTILGRE